MNTAIYSLSFVLSVSIAFLFLLCFTSTQVVSYHFKAGKEEENCQKENVLLHDVREMVEMQSEHSDDQD